VMNIGKTLTKQLLLQFQWLPGIPALQECSLAFAGKAERVWVRSAVLPANCGPDRSDLQLATKQPQHLFRLSSDVQEQAKSLEVSASNRLYLHIHGPQLYIAGHGSSGFGPICARVEIFSLRAEN
jgi:hypothetical protein